MLAQAVYGLPEVARDELKTVPPVVACPGCYPTASALAALPVMEAGLKGEGPITIAALSGVSGAGRKATPKTHFCNADESVGLYACRIAIRPKSRRRFRVPPPTMSRSSSRRISSDGARAALDRLHSA